MKLYCYDSCGDLQETPTSDILIISEKELNGYRNENYTEFPMNVGLSRPLVPDEKVNLLLEEDFELKGVEVLSYEKNQLPTDYDEALREEYENSLYELLKDDGDVAVIQHEGSRIWFNTRAAAYIEDMELEEKSESSGKGKLFFLILLLAALAYFLFLN